MNYDMSTFMKEFNAMGEHFAKKQQQQQQQQKAAEAEASPSGVG
jgi:hypothetical protein